MTAIALRNFITFDINTILATTHSSQVLHDLLNLPQLEKTLLIRFNQFFFAHTGMNSWIMPPNASSSFKPENCSQASLSVSM